MGWAVLAATQVAAVIFLTWAPAHGETLRWGERGNPGWWYTDEKNSVMLAGKPFAFSNAEASEEAKDTATLYFFCTPSKHNDPQYSFTEIKPHVTMLFQPPSKYVIPRSSGSEYWFAIYTGRVILNMRAPALDGERAGRVELAEDNINKLRDHRDKDYLHIGYGWPRGGGNRADTAWSRSVIYNSTVFGPAFNFFIRHCLESAIEPEAPPPPPPPP